MATPEMAQVRRAALLLHGLSPSMRAQVLARLGAAESILLKPLLGELTDLGVSPQAGLPSSTERALTVAEQVERFIAEDVVRCLESCAPMTVARLMRAGNWSWKARALELMPEARRAVVFEYMRSASPVFAPEVLDVLQERLCACAARLQLERAQTSGCRARTDRNAWSAWLTRIKAGLERSLGWMR